MLLRIRLGWILAATHLAVVAILVYSILFANEPDWPMYWLALLLLDAPANLLVMPIDRIFYELGFRQLPGLPSPFDSLSDFWIPVIVFGLLGTLWYFYLPRLLAALFNRNRWVAIMVLGIIALSFFLNPLLLVLMKRTAMGKMP